MGKRLDIPAKKARILRQESSFGCCICGRPIFQYHHIIPWEIREHFDVEDMMCLCPNHHDEATKGSLTEEEQRNAKANPYNVEQGYAEGLLKVNHNIPIIQVGNCNIVGEGEFFVVDEKALLSFRVENEHLLVSISLYDENNNMVLEIIDNEWVSGDPTPWDIVAGYQTLKISHKLWDVGLDIDVRSFPITLKAKLKYSGQSLEIKNSGVCFRGQSTISFQNISCIGGCIYSNTQTKQISLGPNKKYGKWVMAGKTDIPSCIAALENLKKSI